jgi:hypothetical protein
MSTITLELESIDEVLLVRYLNLAIAESKKSLDLILENPETFAKYPVWESNAKFDIENSQRLKDIIDSQRKARDEAERRQYGLV